MEQVTIVRQGLSCRKSVTEGMEFPRILVPIGVVMAVLILFVSGFAEADERPYFVTVDHSTEEPGDLEVNFSSKLGLPKKKSRFESAGIELEYGVQKWWSTEFRIAGQTILHDSTGLTGFEWENRFRLLKREHRFNPMVSFEFENIKSNDKTVRDVTGSRRQEVNDELQKENEREVELKLILSGSVRGWSLSENIIAAKDLGPAPWEFGYAVGASHSIGRIGSSKGCRYCPENLNAGIEFYGGLGTSRSLGLSKTAHYVAPALAYRTHNGLTVRVSPSFGLSENSYPFILAFGFSLEFSDVDSKIGSLFRK